jgi:hypothetical protein
MDLDDDPVTIYRREVAKVESLTNEEQIIFSRRQANRASRERLPKDGYSKTRFT